MPEENRIFDVARPGRSAAAPNSKPVIVGHHPMLGDPMVKIDNSPLNFGTESAATKITVHDDTRIKSETEENTPVPVLDQADLTWSQPVAEPESEVPIPAAPVTPAPHLEPAVENDRQIYESNLESTKPTSPDSTYPQTDIASESLQPDADPLAPQNRPLATRPAEVEALHIGYQKNKGRRKRLLLLIIPVLLAGYLAADSGRFGSGDYLPFHIYKHKSAGAAEAPANRKSSPPVSDLPAGYTQYQLNGTTISFAAPVAWGQPTYITQTGYSSRSASTKPDGVYLNLVNFTINKDIQIAITSSKYLPASGPLKYYDYLQWCSGTNDSKIYKSLLRYSSASGVDTPTTITCDQGPITDAVQLDSSTIVQLKTKDETGAVMGDLYTKNLPEKVLPVLRVKDASMANGASIKILLSTVKSASS